jgi:DNA polymerase-3 subunit gamma/tau
MSSHRALTLKYRPQAFSDVVGQDHVSAVLARAVESGRIANAFLFTGARGVGKTTSARILAKALNCEARRAGRLAGADPCNVCPTCVGITTGASLDVTEIDGASNRGIADVQALRERVRFTPAGGAWRVVIIDEVHQLSGDAFAALLKTLEEPPPHLVFIFATTDPQKLPDTIRSRTQRFDFARVPLRKVADRLITIQAAEAQDPGGIRFTLTEGAALLLAHKSEGSMRDAVSALDQVVSAGEPAITEELVRRVLGLADREAFFALADAIVARDPKAALRRLQEATDKGLDPRELIEGLAEHIRHLLVLKVDPAAGDLVAATADDIARLRAQGEGWTETDLLRLLRLASEAGWPMRDSPQPLLHLEAAVLQMATLEPGETLAQILERLESLERRLAGGPGAPVAGAAAPGAPARGTHGGPRAAGPVPGPAHAPNLAPPRREGGDAPPAGGGALRAAVGGAVAPESRAAAVSVREAPPVAVEAYGALADPGGEAAQRWAATVAAVNQRKRMLGAFLEESRFLGAADDALTLAMDDLHRAVVEEKDNRAILAEAARRAFGRPVVVRCVPLDAAGIGPRRPAASEDVAPLIEKAIAFFEGDVLERPARPGERTDG